MAIDLLNEINIFDLSAYTPIRFKKKNIGWLNNKTILNNSFNICNDYIEHSQLDAFIKILEKSESSTETCPVFLFPSLKPKKVFSESTKFCKNNIFIIKRNLLSLFGLPSYGVHCNVWRKHKDKFVIYFAKRSEKLKSFPGYIDNTVAGGQPINLSIFENLKKEAYEEAGISCKYLKKVQRGNIVSYFHNNNNNFISAVIFNYHLNKVDELELKNIDGEVESFFSLPLENIYKLLEKNLLKPNCIIPILDFILLNDYHFLSKGTIVEIKKILRLDE